MKATPTAVDFMITHAWAISIALVSIGLFVYFAPALYQKAVPERTILGSGFVVLDHEAGQNEIKIAVKNTRPETVTISRLELTDLECSYNEDVTLAPNQMFVFAITCQNLNAKFLKSDIELEYIGSSELSHKVVGNIIARIG